MLFEEIKFDTQIAILFITKQSSYRVITVTQTTEHNPTYRDKVFKFSMNYIHATKRWKYTIKYVFFYSILANYYVIIIITMS